MIAAEYDKVEDILDVWFDSGSTHAFCAWSNAMILRCAGGCCICEGSDQHRGWFQSSLLESCGTRGRAPYGHLVTNGFVGDGEGRKMSKSLGNVMAPDEIIKSYGAEIIRIWVASSDYTDDMRVSKEIIDTAVDSYRKLRNTLRYLLGALADFDEEETVAFEDMPELERYMLHLIAELDQDVRERYAAFDFKGVWRKLFDFCSTDLSAFYLDIRKDALYCDRPDDQRRRAARTVMNAAFDRIVHWLAPICVFTAEEAWLERYKSEDGSVHLQTFPQTPATWRDEKLAEQWARLRVVRRVVTGALEVERREKRIGASLEAAPEVFIADDALRAAVESHDLAELFITGAVTVTDGEGPADAFRLTDVAGVAVTPRKTDAQKCQRCWRYTGDVGVAAAYPGLCVRCAVVVEVIDKKESAL